MIILRKKCEEKRNWFNFFAVRDMTKLIKNRKIKFEVDINDDLKNSASTGLP